MHVTDDTATDTAGMKRRARLLAREAGIPHRQALDILARTAGYSHWGSYCTTLRTAAAQPGWRSACRPRTEQMG